MTTFRDEMTLGAARDVLRGLVDDGAECPCCRQLAKVYRRTMTAPAARALIALWRVHREDFGHLPTVVREHCADVAGQGGYTSLSAHWGLMEKERAVDPANGRVGYWRVTPRGVDWLLGRAVVPKHAVIYNDRCLRLEGPAFTVVDALAGHFRLQDLLGPHPMGGVPTGPDAQVALFATERRQTRDALYGVA